MSKLRTLTVAGFAAAAIVASTSASNAISVVNGGTFNPGIAGENITNNTSWTDAVGTVQTRVGSSSGQWRSPFENFANGLTFTYVSVQQDSSAKWILGPSTSLSIVWGSPDNYNYIDFYSNSTGFLGTVNGHDNGVSPPGPNATGNTLVTISGLGLFDYIIIRSPGTNAFEFSNLVSTCVGAGCGGPGPGETPIPGAAFLMGSVLAGGAGFGAWRRRRKAA